ncbi:MAG: hypothetical protein AAFX87_17195 [Bacteroidota bacterium]
MRSESDIYFKPFDYIKELDAFVINKAFDEVARQLGISEWHSAVWIGRFFTLDSDYGEHWFDNWDLRSDRRFEAEKLGIDDEQLMVVDPFRFKMKEFGGDGPCHTDEHIKRFWTDVLKSFSVSLETMAIEARTNKQELEAADDIDDPEFYIEDLEDRIEKIRVDLS